MFDPPLTTIDREIAGERQLTGKSIANLQFFSSVTSHDEAANEMLPARQGS